MIIVQQEIKLSLKWYITLPIDKKLVFYYNLMLPKLGNFENLPKYDQKCPLKLVPLTKYSYLYPKEA